MIVYDDSHLASWERSKRTVLENLTYDNTPAAIRCAAITAAHSRSVGEGTIRVATNWCGKERTMIRKLKSGEYRLYSRKVNPKTGRRRNLGTFNSRKAAEQHERDIQYFKRH